MPPQTPDIEISTTIREGGPPPPPEGVGMSSGIKSGGPGNMRPVLRPTLPDPSQGIKTGRPPKANRPTSSDSIRGHQEGMPFGVFAFLLLLGFASAPILAWLAVWLHPIVNWYVGLFPGAR